MKTNHLLFIFLALTMTLTSCEKALITEDYENTPVHNFDAFCTDFRNMYGAFEAKGLNWDSLTSVYSGRVSDSTTPAALFGILSEMLHELNDGHADLRSARYGHFRSWNRRNKPFFIGRAGNDFDDVVLLQNLIQRKYLDANAKSELISGWQFFYGAVNFEGSTFGYICVPTFNINDFPLEFIQSAVDEFKTSDAVIIDLRFNQGGRTDAFVSMQNRFGSVEKLYMKSQFRNGPGLSDFTHMAEHRMRPHSNALKDKPMAILTNAYSASSSDHFTLALKSQPNVISVGDTTCGAFSAVLERILPNGWKYRLGAQVVYKPDGNFLTDDKGNYLEGIGIAPDFWVVDDWTAVSQNRDAVLDKALVELSNILKLK